MTGPALKIVADAAPGPHPEPRFLEVADAIGRRIVRDAIWSEDRCSWLVWSREPVDGVFTPTLKAAGPDLYMGVAGIALFLARLVGLTDDGAQREALYGAVRQLCRQLDRASPDAIGLYSGTGGAAHTLITIGELLGEEAWIARGLAALEAVAERSDPAPEDLLGGLAGAVTLLADAGARLQRPHLLDAAGRMADLLIARGHVDAHGLSWPAGAGESRNLLGLSHGAGGMALAIYELEQVRPDPRRRQAAAEAIRYERSHYDAAHRNWPDFRLIPGYAPGEPTHPVAWCHGSTGVGLTRLRLLELDPSDPALLPEVDVALANAVAALNQPIPPVGGDFTLCHGIAGNADFVLEVGARLGRPDCIAAARQVGDVGSQLFEGARSPWPCGFESGESPSLMLGTAGIGLHYLRLFDPHRTPGVLLPPASAPRVREAAA